MQIIGKQEIFSESVQPTAQIKPSVQSLILRTFWQRLFDQKYVNDTTHKMLLLIILYYLIPALLFSALAKFLYPIFMDMKGARWLYAILLTLSWTPTTFGGGHGMGFAQIILATIFDPSGWRESRTLWTYVVTMLIVFFIVHFFVFKNKTAIVPTDIQTEGAE